MFGAGASTLRIASGTFTVGDASTNQNTISSPGTTTVEVLSGATLQKINPLTTSFTSGVASFLNAGTVEVLGGTLVVNATTEYREPLRRRAARRCSLVAEHDLQAGSSVSGAGTVDFNAGVVNVNGIYNVTGSTTATGAALTMNPTAILTSLGTNVSVSGGTVTLNSGEALSATTLSLTGGTLGGTDTLTLSGATMWSGGTMTGAGTTVARAV